MQKKYIYILLKLRNLYNYRINLKILMGTYVGKKGCCNINNKDIESVDFENMDKVRIINNYYYRIKLNLANLRIKSL